MKFHNDIISQTRLLSTNHYVEPYRLVYHRSADTVQRVIFYLFEFHTAITCASIPGLDHYHKVRGYCVHRCYVYPGNSSV